MLVEFTVGNFRSFRDRVTLSLRPDAEEYLAPSHIAVVGGEKLLRSTALYGLNSGGKTNLLRALRAMRLLVLRSNPRRRVRYLSTIQPFSLSVAHASAPSLFEVTFCLEGIRYRYGFEADREHVAKEWLARTHSGGEEEALFNRTPNEFEVSEKFPEGKDVVERTDAHVLFLSAVSGWNGGLAKGIEEWFRRWQTMVDISTTDTLETTADELENDELRRRVTELAKAARLGFNALEVETPSDPAHDPFAPSISAIERQRLFEARRILTHHPVYDDEGRHVHDAKFDLATDESAGTRKFIALSVRFLPALENGGVVLVDELEAWMHPGMTRQLLALFHSPVNRGNAQLVFATHDTHLLQPDLLRRDQVWFVDKDRFDSSLLRRASDYDIGPNDDMEREYLLGLYGAVPPRGLIEEELKAEQREPEAPAP